MQAMKRRQNCSGGEKAEGAVVIETHKAGGLELWIVSRQGQSRHFSSSARASV